MRITISYKELSSVIKKKTGHDVVFDYISCNKIKVSKLINVPLFGERKIGTELEVIGFDGLNLNVKSGSDLILKLLSILPVNDITRYVEIQGNEICVMLGKIDKLKKVFKNVVPTGLFFDESSVILNISAV